MKLDVINPSPAMRALGTFLELTFSLLTLFTFCALFDWVLFPEKDRPWRSGQK